MLGEKDPTQSSHATWRGFAAVALATLTLAVAAVRAPARPDDQSPATKAEASAPRFFRDDAAGAVVIRPAAAVRHPGVDRLSRLLLELSGVLPGIERVFNVGAKKDAPMLDCKDLEWVTCSLVVGGFRDPEGKPKRFERLCGFAVRAVGPFDWLAFVHQWGIQTTPAGDAGRGYYRLEGGVTFDPGSSPCLYLADDRTAWIDDEEHVKKYLSREDHAPPAFLTGPEWERACRGLAAAAIDNHEGSYLKGYELSRPEDAVVIAQIKKVERVVFSVDDADETGLRVHAACRPGDGSAAASRMIESLVKSGTAFLEHSPPADSKDDAHAPIIRAARTLLANVRVEHTDRTVDVRARGFGRIDELAALAVAAMGRDEKAGNPDAKAASKTKTR